MSRLWKMFLRKVYKQSQTLRLVIKIGLIVVCTTIILLHLFPYITPPPSDVGRYYNELNPLVAIKIDPDSDGYVGKASPDREGSQVVKGGRLRQNHLRHERSPFNKGQGHVELLDNNENAAREGSVKKKNKAKLRELKQSESDAASNYKDQPGTARPQRPIKYGLSRKPSGLYDHRFLITADQTCKKVTDPFLVIMILSQHLHVRIRDTIRKTWGSIVQTGKWKGTTVPQVVRLVFLFGRGRMARHDEIIRNESKIYGDIVQGDFHDSYFNLTYKSVMGVRWASVFCSQAKFLLKADEDVFVHVYNLIQYLKIRHVPKRGIIFGHIQTHSPVLRYGKWAVSNESYPFPRYPTYTSGNTYVISGNIAARVYNTSRYLPFLNIEDVFVTGIVRERIGAAIVNFLGFTHWYQKTPKVCEFQNSVRISATKVHMQLQYWLWDAVGTNMQDCFNSSTAGIGSNIHPVPRHIQYRAEKELNPMISDVHVHFNKSSNQFFVKH